MANFINRVASWLANEIVVKKLSQSQGFQRMAGKAVRNIDSAQKLAKNQSDKISQTKTGVKQDVSEWFRVLKEEAKKDLENTLKK